LDSRYISSELLQKVPSTAVYGQVGNDSGRMLRYEQVLANYKLPDCHPCIEVNTIFGQHREMIHNIEMSEKRH
jgi:hypothetical protein